MKTIQMELIDLIMSKDIHLTIQTHAVVSVIL
jgi:hypothetical protein